MDININKKDVIWGYIALVFNYGTGFFTLPFILSMLSAEEIGLNYLMLTVTSLISLADFGFSQQFGRNLTYALSGAQNLKKEGLTAQRGNGTNFHLVAVLIQTAKYIYMRLALLVTIGMLTLGTAYIHHVTSGFTTVSHSFIIWLLFSISTFFNFYYKYYTSLLTGSSLIMEYNKSCIYSKLSYLIICLTLLWYGCGLLSVVVANFISPFVGRFYSYKHFYTKQMKEDLKGQVIEEREVKETFSILWYNAKKIGIVFLAQYGIGQSSIFICGLFLSLPEIAAYGLLIQLTDSILCSVAKSLFNTLSSLFSKNALQGDKDSLIKNFSLGNFVFGITFILGAFCIIFLAPWVLDIAKSNSKLPSRLVMTIYLCSKFFDYNQSNFSYIFSANNKYPYVKAYIITGVFAIAINLTTLYFTSLGLLGVVAGSFICMAAYNDWKWPREACLQIGTTIPTTVLVGYQEARLKLQKITHKKIIS